MDYLQECVNSFNLQRRGKAQKNEYLPFSAVVKRERVNHHYVDQAMIDEIYDKTAQLKERLQAISAGEGDPETLAKRRQEERQEFREYIGSCKLNYHEMVTLLESLEDDEHRDVRQMLFYLLFEYPNESFYGIIKAAKEPIPVLEESENGDIRIYDSRFVAKI